MRDGADLLHLLGVRCHKLERSRVDRLPGLLHRRREAEIDEPDPIAPRPR